MRFKGLDLNLLIAFDILLTEKSVSRAADRLHLSQSATSAALMRLRAFFDDPILRQDGRSMRRTPFAESLWPKVRACLQEAQAVIATTTAFDPATSRRTFRVVASDYAMMALLVDFTRAILPRAPGITFDFSAPDRLAIDALERGDVDLFLWPGNDLIDDHRVDPLFEDGHVVMGWDRHPIFDGPVTAPAIQRFRHVAVALSADRLPAFGDHHLAQRGFVRNIAVTAASFGIVPWLLIDSDMLAVMPERLAMAAARVLPIRFAPLPIAIPMICEAMRYHGSRATDDGLSWLRRELQAFARQPE